MAKILVVDDSIVMRKNLTAILEGAGHEVVGEASNGRHAVSQYNELMPDVVTMDISMPIMSGVEAVAAIISEHPEAKIIMISAVNQKKMVFGAIKAGAKHYVMKPIESESVLNVIHEVMSDGNERDGIVDAPTTEQGFSIENVNGKFIVRFNEHLDVNDQSLLNMAINGILFIKPLKVVFDFGDLADVDDDMFASILEMKKAIERGDGEVTVESQSASIRRKAGI